MITLLAMGQSNAVGRQVGGVTTALPGVTVWNNRGDTTAMTDLGNAFVIPDINSDPFVGGCNNMFLHMANNLKRVTGEDVRLILVARGGQSIDMWANASGTRGTLYNRMEAVLAAAGVSEVDIFAWHQGEADNSTSGTYATRWNHLIANLTSDGYIDGSTPAILGETASQYTNINPVLRSIANSAGRFGIAQISNMPTYDDTHFTGVSMPEIGERYVRALSATNGTAYSGILDPKNLDLVDVVVRDPQGNLKVLRPSDLNDSRRKVAFRATLGSILTVPTATWTHVPFDTVEFNHGDYFNPVTGLFSPPAGVYQITFSLILRNGTVGESAGGAIYKNGSTYMRQPQRVLSNGQAYPTLTSVIETVGDDTFDVRANITGTASPNVFSDVAGTYFCAHEI